MIRTITPCSAIHSEGVKRLKCMYCGYIRNPKLKNCPICSEIGNLIVHVDDRQFV